MSMANSELELNLVEIARLCSYSGFLLDGTGFNGTIWINCTDGAAETTKVGIEEGLEGIKLSAFTGV